MNSNSRNRDKCNKTSFPLGRLGSAYMSNFGYYIACLIVIIIGIFIVKKVVSCMIRAIVGLIVVAILAYVYFMYLR